MTLIAYLLGVATGLVVVGVLRPWVDHWLTAAPVAELPASSGRWRDQDRVRVVFAYDGSKQAARDRCRPIEFYDEHGTTGVEARRKAGWL